MATLASVEAHAKAVAAAQSALVAEMLAAVAAGIPKAAVARAAGVTPQTLYRWFGDA